MPQITSSFFSHYAFHKVVYMQQYKHNSNLIFYHPDSWSGEYDAADHTILFCDPDNGYGSLQFSVLYPPEKQEISLKNWLEEKLEKWHEKYIVTENKHYARSEHVNDDSRSWRYWAIRKDNMMLFGTYNCDEQDQGKEDKIVDEIINSIS